MSRRSRLTLALLVAAVMGLGAPSLADAATVEMTKQDFCICDGLGGLKGTTFSLFYKAEPGELNTAVVSWDEARSSFRVSETTAPLTAGQGCSAASPSEVVCAAVDTCQPSRDFQCGSRWNATIEGGDRGDTLTAQDLRAAPDSDAASAQIDGGEGDDRIVATGSRAILMGGPGHDLLQGGDGNDAIFGGAGPDDMRGGPGKDTLYGDRPSAAADAVSPEPDADVMDGGPGDDTVSYSDRTGAVTVDIASGTGAGAAGEGDTLFSIEDIEGGAGADSLSGDGGPNEIKGGAGDDSLAGRGGNDTLDGWSGKDFLDGGAGDDTLAPEGLGEGAPPAESDSVDGGPGADTLTYDFLTAGVVVNLADDKPDGPPAAPDRIRNIENVAGGQGNDVISGDRGDNVLSGAYGRDRVSGGAGDDVVMADAADRLPDVLSGGTGDDLLAGSGRRPSCGRGTDAVAGISGGSLAVRDCEALWVLPHAYLRWEVPPPAHILELAARPPRVTSKAVVLRAVCPLARCSAPVRIRSGQKTVATGRVALKRGKHGDVRVPLTPSGRRLLTRARTLQATVQVGSAGTLGADLVPIRLAR